MPTPRIWRDTVWESGTKYNRARLTDRDGSILVIGDFVGVVITKVYDMASADVDSPIFQESNTVASVVTNTLQTWEVDTTGYNFEYGVTSNNVAMDGGHTYRACHYLTHATEGSQTIVFEMRPETLLGT